MRSVRPCRSPWPLPDSLMTPESLPAHTELKLERGDLMTISTVENRRSWVLTAEYSLRRLAAVTWVGALLGLLVGGIGSRLAMMLLAKLNPAATGVVSDDGFTMGQLTLQTLDLLTTTTLIGVFGGGIYFVLRGVMIGPRWFQILSVSLGPAVVIGSILVHVDGVDFTLRPVWLAIAMFVAMPWIYAALLTVIAERFLASDGRFMSTSIWLALAPLLLWIPIAPILGVLLLGLLAFEAARRTPSGDAALGHSAGPWLVRVALALLFTMSLIDLVRDTVTLI